MHRICGSLSDSGYKVTLVGRQLPQSPLLIGRPFEQVRLNCFFTKRALFYIEYNIRLFFWLLVKRTDIICAIDLDTILPVYFASVIRKKKRVYDAHELFCEMKEIATRPGIYKIWKKIEQFSVPKFNHGYTVNQAIAQEFNRMYGVNYSVVRNLSTLKSLTHSEKQEKFLLYQGAVNEGRSFETLIPAMQYVNIPLWICGNGNFMQQVKMLVKKHNLEQKVIFKGYLTPEELWLITQQAWAGITLFENKGKSNYYSLANRFFDYIQAGIPQLCVNYPEYKTINEEFDIAYLIDNTNIDTIVTALNKLLEDENLYERLKQNSLKAREVLNWNNEEKKLIDLYDRAFM